jgi:RNA polymerase primary sigma factor
MRQLKITNKITDRASSQSFNFYLSDVRAIKPFDSPQEEYECALKAFKGDGDAIDELVTRNLKFVISVAKQYSTSKIPLEELVNEGNFGLIEAAKKFDPSRGFKFISYAVWYIRKSIGDYITKNSRTIRIPLNKVSKLGKLKKEMEILEQINNRPTTINDLVSHEGSEFDINDINLLMSIESMNMMSLDSPIGQDDDSGSMIDVIEDQSVKSTDHIVNNNDFKTIIELIINKLSEKQKQVIYFSYGLEGGEPLSLVEIGEKMHMSREGVRQVREKALKILRISIRKSGIKSELF